MSGDFGNFSPMIHGLAHSSPTTGDAFSPTSLTGLAAWYKFNAGQTVAQWNDQTANARHLVQATGANQPTLSSGAYTFDGNAQYMRVTGFTLSQPVTIAMRLLQVTWTQNDEILSGGSSTTDIRIRQRISTPAVKLYAGLELADVSAPTGVWHSVIVVANSSSSVMNVDGTEVTGDAFTNGMPGITLGANEALTAFANVSVRELFVANTAADAPTRALIKAYLDGI